MLKQMQELQQKSQLIQQKIQQIILQQHNHTITSNIPHMINGFQTTLKRKKTRERFYSSMNYDEFYLLYGPPAPITKPMQDPTEDIPPLQLQQEQPKIQQTKQEPKMPTFDLHPLKLETIYEIDGSQNQTHTIFKSPRMDFNDRKTLKPIQQEYSPKRMRVRNRSQSDNSEYLIFNFLERQNQRAHKKPKLQ